MPITTQCSGCGKTLQAPDAAAGKQARCPQCGALTRLPGPETAAPGALPTATPVGDANPPAGAGPGYDLAAPAAGGAPSPADERRPCPMCGELIPLQAMKCRFCGHVFDPRLAAASPMVSGVAPGTPIKSYMAEAVVCTVFSVLCCNIFALPFAIIAIVYASKVNNRLAANDYGGAAAASQSAKTWSWVAGIVLIAIIALGVMANAIRGVR